VTVAATGGAHAPRRDYEWVEGWGMAVGAPTRVQDLDGRDSTYFLEIDS